MQIHIGLNQLLWRTRGLNWDYSFLLRPTKPIVTWYGFIEKVFASQTPTTTPKYVARFLDDGVHRHFFHATLFVDPARQDAAGRPIAHYLAWFPSNVPELEVVDSIPTEWGNRVVETLSTQFDEVFNSPGVDIDPESNLSILLRNGLSSICIDGNPQQVTISGTIELQKKKAETIPQNKASTIFWTRVAPILIGFAILLFVPWFRKGLAFILKRILPTIF